MQALAPRRIEGVRAPLYERDAEPDPADAEVLQALMMVGHSDRVEFLA